MQEENKIELQVSGLTSSQIQSGAYAVILKEKFGSHRIPVIVGTPEAQSIAIALDNIHVLRPLSHDLFISLTKSLNATVEDVLIYKFEEGIFYSEIRIVKRDDSGTEEELALDSRTSDALAIALRLNCPIYTTLEVLQECGVFYEGINECTFNEDDSEDMDDDDDYDDPEDDFEEEDSLLDDEDFEPSEFQNVESLNTWLGRLSIDSLTKRMESAIARENYEYASLYKKELERRRNKSKD